jgi:hypothetical protein
MRGAIPPLPNTPSRRGTQSTGTTSPFIYYITLRNYVFRKIQFIPYRKIYLRLQDIMTYVFHVVNNFLPMRQFTEDLCLTRIKIIFKQKLLA